MATDSTLPGNCITEDAADTGFGQGRIGMATLAPAQTLTPPAPGAGDEPHAVASAQLCGSVGLFTFDGNNWVPVEGLPPDASVRIAITAAGLRALLVLVGRTEGNLHQAYPPVA